MFIELTYKGCPMSFNLSQVKRFTPVSYGKQTCLTFTDESSVTVKETYDQVKALMAAGQSEVTYKELAEELTKRLYAIDDVCSYCAEPKGEDYCTPYKNYAGNVPIKICCAGVKKFMENNRG